MTSTRVPLLVLDRGLSLTQAVLLALVNPTSPRTKTLRRGAGGTRQSRLPSLGSLIFMLLVAPQLATLVQKPVSLGIPTKQWKCLPRIIRPAIENLKLASPPVQMVV